MVTGSFVPMHVMVRPSHCPLSSWLTTSEMTDVTACPRTEIGNISNVERFTQIVSQAGLSLAQYEIQFFTFMPDPAGYITVLHSADSSMTLCVWEHVQRDLDDILEREAHNGIRYVAVGKNGSFVVLLNTGKMMWSGIPEPLNQLLADAERRNRVVVVSVITFLADKGPVH